jgi:hypothetical protein
MQEHENGVYRVTGNIVSISSRRSGTEVAGFRQSPRLRTKYLSLLLLPAFLISLLFSTNALGATLSVQFPGGGTGHVYSSSPGIDCTDTCSGSFTSGTLYADPGTDSIFSGWGGVCAGKEICSLTLSADSTVTALFTLKSSPVQVSGSYYGALQKACNNVAAGGVVMAVAQDQLGDLNLNKGISLTLKGGYDASFLSNAGNVTEINGAVSLVTGSMTVENIAIGQSLSSLPTAPPTNITALPGNGQVTLTWDTMPGDLTYNVYYSTTTGVTRYNGTQRTGTSTPSLTITGLTNGTTHYFVVTAMSTNGESVESNQVIIAPVLPAPTGVSATAANGQVSVSWSTVSGATSYKIYYSNSASVSKTNGTVITVNTNPKVISLANNSTYWFVVTAVGVGGESVESSPAVPATPVVPPTADLVGTWNFIRFASGPGVTNGSEPGWMRGNATIATNGTVTINSIVDSSGGNTPPPVGSLAWTMNASGVVTQVGDNALDNDNHGIMAANKQVIAGTGSFGNDNRAIYVCVKQASGFSNADLTNKNFVYHQLSSGSDNEWQYGAGTVNSSLEVVLSSLTDPGGTTPNPGKVDSITLDNNGIMTSTMGTGSQEWGLMTPDKSMVFVTETNDQNTYTFRVIQWSGLNNYSQSVDMAGIWRSHALVSNPPIWEYSSISINSAGLLTDLEYLDSTGDNQTSDDHPTVVLNLNGTITVPLNPTLHGMMSSNKKIAVFTESEDAGEVVEKHSLTIVLKQ